mmetsp:Transcript_1911/g.3172  ORF Transcript_1911/g.3172 Transcript_1911/m.3172 type:complete len:158 (-) Transcript_1911:245-718(-)
MVAWWKSVSIFVTKYAREDLRVGFRLWGCGTGVGRKGSFHAGTSSSGRPHREGSHCRSFLPDTQRLASKRKFNIFISLSVTLDVIRTDIEYRHRSVRILWGASETIVSLRETREPNLPAAANGREHHGTASSLPLAPLSDDLPNRGSLDLGCTEGER